VSPAARSPTPRAAQSIADAKTKLRNIETREAPIAIGLLGIAPA